MREGDIENMNKKLERKISRVVCKRYSSIARRKTDKRDEHNILVMSCQAIGDTITRIPFLRELRKNYQRSYITLVCTARTYNLIELCPYVDEIVVYNPELKKKLISKRFLDGMYKSYKFGQELTKRRSYEMAIILSAVNHEEYEAWIPFFAGVKRIIGYTEKVDMLRHEVIDGTYDMYLTDVLQPNHDNHEVENNLEILRYLNCRIEDDKYEIWINDTDRKAVKRLLDENVCANKMKIVVNLSANCREREWPIEKYIDVCKRLNEEYDIQFILVGAGEIARKYGDIYSDEIPNVCNLIDKTSIRETWAIMEKSTLYLGSETGTTHLAASAGLSGVAIYLPDNVVNWFARGTVRFSPWKSDIKVISPQNPLPGCEHGCYVGKAHCIAQVTSDEVYDAMVEKCEQIQTAAK